MVEAEKSLFCLLSIFSNTEKSHHTKPCLSHPGTEILEFPAVDMLAMIDGNIDYKYD